MQVKTAYKDWFPRMVEYGFSEGEDFNPLKIERVQDEGGRKVTRTVDDHQLTIPMAKELCMIQRNELGKQARQYFLAVEAQWNSPEAVMRRAVLIAQKQNDQLKAVNKQLLAENSEMEPWAKFGKAYHTSPENSMLLREFAANVLKPNGIPLGEKDLFKYFEDHGYLVKNKKSARLPPSHRKSWQKDVYRKAAFSHGIGWGVAENDLDAVSYAGRSKTLAGTI